MDFFDLFVLIFRVYIYIAISLLPIVFYKTFFVSKYKPNSDYYYRREWYHYLKVFWAMLYINNYKKKFSKILEKESNTTIEEPRKLTTFMRYDSQTIYGIDQKGNSLYMKITLREHRMSELCLQLQLANGVVYQLPSHPSVLICSIPERKWQAGGLEITIVEPFQILRIVYNGFLRNCIRNNKNEEIGDVLHCRFNFIWSAASEPKYFPQDMTAVTLAHAVAVEPWKNKDWIKLLGYQTGFDQYGMLHGQVSVDNGQAPTVMRLTSCRKRTWGPSKCRTLHRSLTLFGADNEGRVFTINVKSYINGCKELHIGTMILPNRQVAPINDCDISLPDLLENGCVVPGAFSFSFTVRGKSYNCTAFSNKASITNMKNNEIKGYKSKLVKMKYMINGAEAAGYGVFWFKHQGSEIELPSYIIRPGVQIVEPERKFVANFASPECRSEYLAGVKGTALTLLFSVDSNNFKLLDGFCILVPALQEYLNASPKLKEVLTELQKLCGRISLHGELENICTKIRTLFGESPIPSSLQEFILNELQLLKFKATDIGSENLVKHCWAVRSSAVDEDLEKYPRMRNCTFLDCFTDEDVLKAITACWASPYMPEKVLHRRKRGLPIVCDMAVIVQYAINSDVSGVLTTCDLKTADPGIMSIKSTHGLGTTVVTNMIEPDVITISRSWNDKLTISHTTIGSKSSIMTIGSNRVETVENKNKKLLSLTSEQIFIVSKVGLLLEKAFGGPRDVDWAFYKDNLYLLDIKPVRFQFDWTKFDLVHEHDTPLLTDTDSVILNTTDNVLPGISSHLTQSLCLRYLDESLQRLYLGTNDFRAFIFKILTTYKHHVGVNAFQSVLRQMDKEVTEEYKTHEIVLAGRSILTEDLRKEAIARNGPNNMKNTIVNLLKSLKYCWNSGDYAEEAKILSRAIRIISYEEFSPFEYLNVIKRNLHLLNHVINLNTMVNYTNIFYQKLLLNLLYDEQKGLSAEAFHEMLDTYSQGSDYDMANKVELMAVLIKNKHRSGEFCKLNPIDVPDWMQEHCCDVLSLFKKFMKKYGCRGVQELDLKSTPWEFNTFALVKILQKLIQKLEDEDRNHEHYESKRKRTVSVRERMNGRILRWIEGKVENSFVNKEKANKATTFTVNKFRLAYLELGKKFKQEGKLPEAKLVFYLTQTELEELAKRKNPDLVTKAIKRATLSDESSEYIPDLFTGSDIFKREEQPADDTFLRRTRLFGNIIVQGHVKGRICVMESIRDVNLLQPGDILVTKYLDLGWSPYFPLITGIVTEYGSSTSQGAISVRKRNLPCIISVKNVTKIFKTGDRALLLANNGVIEKLTE